MNKTIDFFIDSKKDLAEFEFYLEEELNIKSVTLKSVMFYNAYVDLMKGIFYKRPDIDGGHIRRLYYPIEDHKEFNLNNFCDFLNDWETADHVKFHSDKNHLIIELLKNVKYNLPDVFPDPGYVSFNKLFGFKETFTWKGKYRSPKSIIGTPPILFLRSNLIDKQNTFYNNKYSDIICHFPTDTDIDGQKLQIYEPPNCTKNANKCTNYLKFEITDENSKVINFSGKPVKIHLSFEVFPFEEELTIKLKKRLINE